jgi:aspartate--ammonia ligase
MGIRVNSESLKKQIMSVGQEERLSLYFHKRLINNELPLCIGGGIGQSRLCMFYLRKAHIGEIQSSIWPLEMKENARKHGIFLI